MYIDTRRIYTYICIYIYIHLYLSIYLSTYLSIYLHVYICTYIYTHHIARGKEVSLLEYRQLRMLTYADVC